MPIRARLTVWYVAALVLVLVAFSGGVLLLQIRFSRAQFDEDLGALASAVSTAIRAELAEKHDLAHAAAEAREDVNVPNRTIAILDADGRPLAAHWRGFHRTGLPSAAGHRPLVATIVQDGVPWRVRLQHETSPDYPFQVFVAASENPLMREERLLARTLLLGTPLALMFAAFVCWWAASRALRPVSDMSAQAEQITVQSLDVRLSGGAANDEVGQLRRAFNSLLDRVAAGVTSQRQFMADASHELRTPVTAARTAAEVTLSQPRRDEAEYRDALTVIAAQTARLGRMVDDMLVLARADAGGYPLRLGPCVADELMEECADAARLLASAQNVPLDTEIERAVVLEADGALVRQLTMNLLENAIKHTPEGGRVHLSLRSRRGAVEIRVSDTGCGIPDTERHRIFERFVRLDASREASGGAGLGLPIARWIAECHQGTLTLEESGPSGSTFVARLPIRAGTPAAAATAARRAWDAYARRVAASSPTVAREAT